MNLHKELEYKIKEIKNQSQIIYEDILGKIEERTKFLKYLDNFYKSYIFSPIKSDNNFLEKISKNILERIKVKEKENIEEKYKNIFKFFPSLEELLNNELQNKFLEELENKFKENDILYLLFLILKFKLIEYDLELEKELFNFYQQRQVQKVIYLDPVIYSQKNLYFLKIFSYKNVKLKANLDKKNSQMPKWHESWNLVLPNEKVLKNKVQNPLINKNFNALKNYLYQHKDKFNKNFYNNFNIVYFDKSVDLDFNYSTIHKKYPKSNDYIFNNLSTFYNLLDTSNTDIDENKFNKFINLFINSNLEFKNNNFFYDLENIEYCYSQDELKDGLIYFDKYNNQNSIKLIENIQTPYNYKYIKNYIKSNFNVYYEDLFKKLLDTFFMYPFKLVEIYQQKTNLLNNFFNFINQKSLKFFNENTILEENQNLSSDLINKINDIYQNNSDIKLKEIIELFFDFLNLQSKFDLKNHKKNIVKGAVGENYILYYLKKILKNKYYIYDNLYLPHPKLLNSLIQVDGLIISPYGIFVLEIKNFSALEIQGNKENKTWNLIYPNNEIQEIGNIYQQNLSHIKNLKNLLGLDESFFISMIIIENIKDNIENIKDNIENIKNKYQEIKIDNNLDNIVFSLIKSLDKIKTFDKIILDDKKLFEINSILKNIRYLDSDTKVRQLNSNYKNRLFYYQCQQQNNLKIEFINSFKLENINIKDVFENYINNKKQNLEKINNEKKDPTVNSREIFDNKENIQNSQKNNKNNNQKEISVEQQEKLKNIFNIINSKSNIKIKPDIEIENNIEIKEKNIQKQLQIENQNEIKKLNSFIYIIIIGLILNIFLIWFIFG